MLTSMRFLRPTALPLRQIVPLARPVHTIRPTLPLKPLPFPQHQLSLIYLRRAYSSPTLDKSGKPQENASDSKSNPDPQFQRSAAAEEIKGITRDVAEMISGRTGNMAVESNGSGGIPHGSVKEDFYTITSTLFQSVPKPALYFGLAGTLPYLGTAFGTVFLAREASLASRGLETLTGLDLTTALSTLHVVEAVQITYGAIILSFLGAIHWGMEFAGLGGEHGYKRLMIGTIPVLFAWPTTFLTHGVALAVQWFGFTGTWFLDQRASRDGWTTPWYATYRFYLSLIVGFSIIGTFAGTGYYGAGAGAINNPRSPHLSHTTERVSPTARLDRLAKAKAPPANSPDRSGRIEGTLKGGEFELVDNDDGDTYTVLRKVAAEEEEEEETEDEEEGGEEEMSKEEQKQKNAEFQDKRDELQQDKAPGAMKSDAKDRTGKNANMPGGVEEKEDMKGAGGNRETSNNKS